MREDKKDDAKEGKESQSEDFSELGSSKGGTARAKALTKERRSDIAKKAAAARWSARKSVAPTKPEGALPEAKYRGALNLSGSMGLEVPCYVLDTGQRVIGRTSATEVLTGIKGGGALEKYLGVASLKPFINITDIVDRMVAFELPDVEGLEKHVKGLPADLFIEICQGFVNALKAETAAGQPILTTRQREMAIKASMFLSACAKVGLDAMIDEATGFQYQRAEDALRVKLKAYLAEEMRKWEKTFPEDLWLEFGRLTNWKGSVTQRPKYWGHLVTELIYQYLDRDVAKWLKDNKPKPSHGSNWHQYLSADLGVQKLIQHIWKTIGIAKTCATMQELKQKMAELHGKVPVQITLYLPVPGEEK